MPRESLGPWGRLYATTEEDLAHYDDRQFRAWIGILCRRARSRSGDLPKLKPLRAIYGGDVVDFLIEEGRLTVTDGNTVTVTDGNTYNPPSDPTGADRQRRWRENHPGLSSETAPLRNGVTSAYVYEGSSPTANGHVEDSSLAVGDEEEFRVIQFLATAGVYVPVTGGMYRRVVTLVERRGAENVIAVMQRLKQAGAKSDRQFIFGAENALDKIEPPAKPLRGDQRSAEEVERAFRQ